MKNQYNVIFPELTFTSPGVYKYTVKELTPPDESWNTDRRIYRVIITVVDTGDGLLEAHTDYPDGVPRFVNTYCPPTPPKPPRDVCKLFNKLPFPLLMFYPPQKPEFDGLMETSPDVFDWWEIVSQYFE